MFWQEKSRFFQTKARCLRTRAKVRHSLPLQILPHITDRTNQNSTIQGAACEIYKENTIQIKRGLLILQKQNLWLAK